MPEPNGEPLTVEGALKTLHGLEGFEPGLYRRTEGITWMIWGLATAGIYFTFGTFGAASKDAMPGFPFLWLPWVLAGIVATVTLWRSVHLAAGLPVGSRWSGRHTLVYFLVYFVLFGIGIQLRQHLGSDWNLKEPGYIMAVLAVASTVASFGRPASTAARTMIAVVGCLALLAALLLATVVGYASLEEAYLVQTYVSALVLGGGWFLGGVALTLKG